jgi:hypothetical protein
MSGPGVPPPLHIDDANANGQLDPGDVGRTAETVGFRRDVNSSVRNLAVPGENIESVFEELGADDVGKNLLSGDIKGRDVLKFLILGLPLRDHPVSQLRRAHAIRPTFLMVWLGNNDVLPMATRTNPQAATFSPAEFGSRYRQFLGSLADTGADMAVANLPDVTQVAGLRHAGTDVTSCRNDDGSVVPVAPEALLSIALDPSQLPVPPCSKVLDPGERAQVRATVMAFNAEIAAAVTETEQSRGIAIALVDVFSLFDDLATHGYPVGDSAAGGFVLDTRYLGGLFSLDGVHPTRTGQALIANAFIAAEQARFGDVIPPVDVQGIATTDPLVNSQYRPAGEPPFGLIADQGVDVQDALDDAFGHLESNSREIFKKMRRRVHDLFDRIARVFS